MTKKTGENAHITAVQNERNPSPTTDIIIELDSRGIVLIERKFAPFGWAIPGGFIEYGESAEAAAVREAREETGLKVELSVLLGVYSRADRDPRRHTLTVVYVATAEGIPVAADDAKNVGVFKQEELPEAIAFDHAQILADYFHYIETGLLPSPAPPSG